MGGRESTLAVTYIGIVYPNVLVDVVKRPVEVPSSQIRIILRIVYDKKVALLFQDSAAFSRPLCAPLNIFIEFSPVRDVIVLYSNVIVRVGVNAICGIRWEPSQYIENVFVEYSIEH